MSTSSSDEDERLKEAIDSELFTNSLYDPSKCGTKVTNNIPKTCPSKCNQYDSTSAFNFMEIKVTPEFRNYVSKHLRRILDEMVDDTKELPTNRKLIANSMTSGVKLLKNSHTFLDVTAGHTLKKSVSHWKQHKRKISGYNSSDDSSSSSSSLIEKRAKLVAVTSEWVLSGKETEYWAPETRGELEVIRVQHKSKKFQQGLN